MGQSVLPVALRPDLDLPLPQQLQVYAAPCQLGSHSWALAATQLYLLPLSSPPSQA